MATSLVRRHVRPLSCLQVTGHQPTIYILCQASRLLFIARAPVGSVVTSLVRDTIMVGLFWFPVDLKTEISFGLVICCIGTNLIVLFLFFKD